MWRVTYTDIWHYNVQHNFTTRKTAEEFIAMHGLVNYPPNQILELVNTYAEPTLGELQAIRNRIGDHFIAGTITEHEWRWQLALADAMVDRIIYNGPAVTCPR